ncbi:outer membrane protein OmpA-like peptidoglycan-associated protein [Roseinatronobacter thiooxidans]|uniref:Outer membrane protein OmpA-like peptidoglycan-associated protein n=1 Tax=Roseinatronobacter thiooxidans TaxID=121821 RepID=A0A2W7Q5J9_9RHOB|nr:OmpA family protein [Roseinatronobacter thiooxidans]PZX39437.1 outer membrane protein OmpA-like peptidoglycan-associated protein [Roseinatronobacter thiooxidans]
MSRRNFHATTALGLCLAMVPLSAAAQSTGADPEAAEIFVPMVQDCVIGAREAECQQVRTVITECAADLEYDRCQLLFEDANAVFDDSQQLEQAEMMLVQTSEIIAQMDFSEADAELGDLAESARADAERTLLRGDENLMTHSAPPLVEGEAEDIDADLETPVSEIDAQPDTEEGAPPAEDVTDPEPQDEASDVDAENERLVREALEAQRRAAEDAASSDAAEAGAEADLAVEAEGDAEQRLRDALEAEQRATDEGADADAAVSAEIEAEAEMDATSEDVAQDDAEQRLRDALEAEQSATEPALDDAEMTETPSEMTEGDAAAARAQAEIDFEEERAQMRAEAEAMAEDEPELVIEEVPEEEFIAPADAPREIAADEQSLIDQLMADPETAEAITLLGQMAEQDRAGEAEGEAGSLLTSALSALQAERSDDAAAEAEGVQAEEVTEEEITAAEIRTSRDDFDSRFALDVAAGQARSSDRRDLERAGLVALGALAVGMVVNRNRVVARSDERVVVQRDDGEYAVWRDDDVILSQDGSQRRIERYADGSTLTRWARNDGSEIVTIRDATGRVLWRERVLADGTSIELVNDMREVQAIDVSVLPPPRRRELRITQRTDPDLALALLQEAEADARALDRAFTLRQVREVREVREVVPVLSPDPITFEINRANVRPEEARKLSQVGRLMERLIADNPRELFLIEGHTDATGPASYNLALSDRRAESVALALTEFFEIPPENLIIQGYGERYLRIPTAAAEERNRRVAIRRISPLMGL